MFLANAQRRENIQPCDVFRRATSATGTIYSSPHLCREGQVCVLSRIFLAMPRRRQRYHCKAAATPTAPHARNDGVSAMRRMPAPSLEIE